MSDQTFEQSLIALRDWLAFLEEEERRLRGKLERLRRAQQQEEPSLPNPPSSANAAEEEDDWL